MLDSVTGFDWDEGNLVKNWAKHDVSQLEVEQVFFNQPFLLDEDVNHSQDEPRWYVLGQTDATRRLMIVFTVRGKKIRAISARDMSRKERKIYETRQEDDSAV